MNSILIHHTTPKPTHKPERHPLKLLISKTTKSKPQMPVQMLLPSKESY